MPALVLLTGPRAGSRFEVQGTLAIGRSPSCEIALDDERVSRRHALVELEEGQAFVQDLDSRNGTQLNGAKLEGRVALRVGDELQLGSTTVVVESHRQTPLSARPVEEVHAAALDGLLPTAGPGGALFACAIALAGAPTAAAALRRACDAVGRALEADAVVALARDGGGFRQLHAPGRAEVPRALAEPCVEGPKALRAQGELAVPVLGGTGAPWGLLYARRRRPFDERELQLAAAAGRLCGEALTARAGAPEPGADVPPAGASLAHAALLAACREAAASGTPLSVEGPQGSGRTFLAGYLHRRSPRRDGPLVVVDCAAPGAEALLLGPSEVAPGQGWPSALARADGGTLVLESPGQLGPSATRRLQAHLAAGTAPRPGGGEDGVDVRVIATFTGPHEREAPGWRHLFLSPPLRLLPLEERQEDVAPLLQSLLDRRAARAGVPSPRIGPEAAEALAAARWPGNLRDLELLAARMIASGPPELVSPGDLALAAGAPPSAGPPSTLQERVARLEREAIAAALREGGGRKIRAAALLGISRPTLDKKIAEYGLRVEKRR